QTKEANAAGATALYRVEFHHEGHLSLSSLRIDQKVLNGEHPWLGAVRIPLPAIHRIARIQPSNAVKVPVPEE
ncbi:MAG TPA: hypothetical protein VFY13_05150, partial [Luteolibacter sp.]|nr:hypothetical protein [Luteolibacter sp.]